METYEKYQVHMTVRGAAGRPYYSGVVEAFGDTPEEAAENAKRELLRTTFRDASYGAMMVDRVEWVPKSR